MSISIRNYRALNRAMSPSQLIPLCGNGKVMGFMGFGCLLYLNVFGIKFLFACESPLFGTFRFHLKKTWRLECTQGRHSQQSDELCMVVPQLLVRTCQHNMTCKCSVRITHRHALRCTTNVQLKRCSIKLHGLTQCTKNVCTRLPPEPPYSLFLGTYTMYFLPFAFVSVVCSQSSLSLTVLQCHLCQGQVALGCAYSSPFSNYLIELEVCTFTFFVIYERASCAKR